MVRYESLHPIQLLLVSIRVMSVDDSLSSFHPTNKKGEKRENQKKI